MHWATKLRTWYDEAVAAIRKNLRPGFKEIRNGFHSITWDVKAKRCAKAGVCWSMPGQEKIWLNGNMTEAHARDTFRHELAHLFANRCEFTGFEDQGHGYVFRKWARAMGDDGARCHNYPELMAIKRGTWGHCPKCPRDIKKCWRGSPSDYSCQRCGSGLRSGRMAPEKVFAVAMAAHTAPDDDVQTLMLTLASLNEAKLGSSPEAKRVRRQLRKLGHTGGMRHE